MDLQEFLPGRLFLPLRGRLKALLLQEVGDGPPPDLVAQVGQGALNPCVAPLTILPSHWHDPLPDLGPHAGTAGAAPLVTVGFADDQPAMSRAQRVR
jgi:hypothetical protein